jgi:hypothetical protein
MTPVGALILLQPFYGVNTFKLRHFSCKFSNQPLIKKHAFVVDATVNQNLYSSSMDYVSPPKS